MRRISIMGVVIGNVVDIVSTYFVVALVAIYFLISLGLSADPTGSATQVLMANSTFRVLSTVLGALCSVLGGYVAARIAKHDDVLNGALSSILCVEIGAYTLLNGSEPGQLGLHLALLPLSPALGALGGYLSYWRRARSHGPTK